MTLQRLRQLALGLQDVGHCRYLLPGTGRDAAFDAARSAPDGRRVDEVFDQIEVPGSWIALYNIEHDPDYRAFLWQVMSRLQPLLRPRETVFDVQGFVFVSAPPSATPFHIDRENNFWLQVRGRKTLEVWDPADRSVVSGPAVEDFILYRGLEGVRLSDSSRQRVTEYLCGPGDGVYFPSTTPHATRSTADPTGCGDATVISIGINFYTNFTRRAAHVHQLNHLLRRLGAQPRHPGSSAWLDALKYPFGLAVTALRRRLRGYRPPPGF